MLGFTQFGLNWGEKIRARAVNEVQMCCVRETTKWGRYASPMPKEKQGKKLQSSTSCFIVFLLFLMAPRLKRIPAFNKGGNPWYCPDIANAIGYQKITHCADNTLLDVWYLSAESQQDLLALYVAQQQLLGRPLPAFALSCCGAATVN
jgi:hypothetical protein